VYAPHTVTLFNASEGENFEVTHNVTVLRGVFLDVTQGVSVKQSGLDNADKATLFIPKSAVSEGLTGGNKRYINPVEYERAGDKAGVWTLRTDGDFFVKGIATTEGRFETINAQYSDVYRINSVSLLDFGTPDMQHFEVGGH
jgi:hypothetical protein